MADIEDAGEPAVPDAGAATEPVVPYAGAATEPAVPYAGEATEPAAGEATEPVVPCADPLGEPFLRARFSLPSLPAGFLRRQRLAGHLDQALGTPLTLLNGPAGAGKTLLAADWAAGLRRPVAWLTTEAADRRPGVFWSYVLQALRASGVPLSPAVGTPADPGAVDRRLLAALAAELSEQTRPAVLVLDEYDRLPDPETAGQLEFVLHHAGPGLRLVLVGRTEPLLPLHRYRAAGELTEIRASELAFTPDEAALLLASHGLDLPDRAVRALVDRTRGWAAGLRLFALAARESDDPERYLKEFEAGSSTIADFLLAEVLKGQTEETQDLLLRVSVLERFRPELADALTLRSDAGPLLAGLCRANAFVERLGHTWYRLHPLFAEILRAHLRERLPGLEPELHRRAAAWFHRSGMLGETLGHGAAAGDWDLAASALVADLAIGRFFTGLHADDLAALFSRMGPEPATPAADLVRAARDLAGRETDQGLARLRRAGEHPGGGSDDAAARMSRALLETLAARLTGCPARGEEAAAEADATRPELPGRLLDAHPELTALQLTHLGSARLWAGRVEDAHAALTAAAGSPAATSTALPRKEALAHLALLDYLNGWPGRAERKALAAVSEAERAGLPQRAGSGLDRLVLAAVAVERHELDRARSLLEEAARHGCDPCDPVPTAGRALVAARLALADGAVRDAAETVRPPLSTVEPSPWAVGHEALVTAARHLAEGRPGEAAEGLRAVPADQPACVAEAAAIQLASGHAGAAADLLDGIRADGRTGPAVHVRTTLVRAGAAAEAGDEAAARALVRRALLDARRERLRRPFLDAGAWLGPLLAEAPLRELAEGWLAPGPPGRDRRGLPEPSPPPLAAVELSGRERDVLERLARMMSTEEIAADLFVSLNTVKTHLKSVYRKLAVNRRGDAVRRAHDLGLL
ncbi:LuxR C-terminal-related transcriptional regulator [Streptomyces rubrolavendulae]|uniref:Serine/threonine-protein kinase PknK n=1 Tax=Streptomyces rubrolavendulae TaxID=285473 RepID=A0A1D8FWT9_9ACTN|nr:Serine/threonine-protein kinase PknK [Streptomyces rubrolavendulae]